MKANGQLMHSKSYKQTEYSGHWLAGSRIEKKQTLEKAKTNIGNQNKLNIMPATAKYRELILVHICLR